MAGIVLYSGPSLIDGAPIVAIATFGSENAKTGDMVQTFILRADVEPHEALKTGQDVSICGDCKHRPANGGSCYVVVHQAPLSVFRAFQRGRYAHDLASAAQACAGRVVRLGTYGDPATVPAQIWRELLAHAAGHTGYTHQWASMLGTERAEEFRPLVMASADNASEREFAQAHGWRTFRVRAADEPVQRGEFMCPASEEAGKRKTCATCRACDGAQRGAAQASPVIIVHGAKGKTNNFLRHRSA